MSKYKNASMMASKELRDALIQIKHLKLQLGALVEHSEQLSLIKEHSLEYFANPRKFKFVDGGFLCYELMDTAEGKSVYFADIFVSKRHRGDSKTLKSLVDYCRALVHVHGLVSAFCRVERKNKHIDRLTNIYKHYGLKRVADDADALYYKWTK